MRLKVNELTNLQDARASAGWGAHYLGFSLERGSMYKLTEAAVQAMLEWISGTFVVIELGADAAQLSPLAPWLQAQHLWVELDGPTAASLWAEGTLTLPVPFGLKADVGEIAHLPIDLLGQAQYIIASGNASTLGAHLPGLQKQLPHGLPLLLQADGLEADALASLLSHADGLAFGDKLAAEFGHLNYDVLEALLDRYPIEG